MGSEEFWLLTVSAVASAIAAVASCVAIFRAERLDRKKLTMALLDQKSAAYSSMRAALTLEELTMLRFADWTEASESEPLRAYELYLDSAERFAAAWQAKLLDAELLRTVDATVGGDLPMMSRVLANIREMHQDERLFTCWEAYLRWHWNETAPARRKVVVESDEVVQRASATRAVAVVSGLSNSRLPLRLPRQSEIPDASGGPRGEETPRKPSGD